MWNSPKTQLRLAADRRHELHRAADLERLRQTFGEDPSDPRPTVRVRLPRPLVARVLAVVSRI